MVGRVDGDNISPPKTGISKQSGPTLLPSCLCLAFGLMVEDQITTRAERNASLHSNPRLWSLRFGHGEVQGRQAHVASHSSSQRGLRLENQETRETAQQHNTRPANSATGNPRAPDYHILQHPVDTEMCEKPLLFYHTVRSYREEHSPQ